MHVCMYVCMYVKMYTCNVMYVMYFPKYVPAPPGSYFPQVRSGLYIVMSGESGNALPVVLTSPQDVPPKNDNRSERE